jgi:hypothetical protein
MEQDAEYIPFSACVEFWLQAVREMEEHPELTELQNANKYLIKTQQSALKEIVLATLRLECHVLQLSLNK